MNGQVGDAARGERLAEAFALERVPGGWSGTAPDWFGGHLFGGMLLGQAVAAANRTAPDGRRIHSLHAYFLRPGKVQAPIRFEVVSLRDGATFTNRTVRAWQDDRQLLELSCSFTADTDGYDYQMPTARDVPPPDAPKGAPPAPTPGPWLAIPMGATPPAPDGTMASTSRAWLRAPGRLADDPHLHESVLALFSDFTFTGGRPLQLEGGVHGLISLDHALWFHRPARVDEWLLYDVHSLVNAGGRGVLRGVLSTPEGVLVASVAQEMLVRPVEDPRQD